jgi:tyrosyl-tRNA synthetase
LHGPKGVVELIVEAGLATSKNQARELIRQGGVSLFPSGEEGKSERISDTDATIDALNGAVLKVGKRRYVRIKV